MTTSYQPISCDFYDELTLVSMRGRVVAIIYTDADGRTQRIVDSIDDIFTLGKEEFVRLGGGWQIRLDRLVEVDGKQLATYC